MRVYLHSLIRWTARTRPRILRRRSTPPRQAAKRLRPPAAAAACLRGSPPYSPPSSQGRTIFRQSAQSLDWSTSPRRSPPTNPSTPDFDACCSCRHWPHNSNKSCRPSEAFQEGSRRIFRHSHPLPRPLLWDSVREPRRHTFRCRRPRRLISTNRRRRGRALSTA